MRHLQLDISPGVPGVSGIPGRVVQQKPKGLRTLQMLMVHQDLDNGN